ncbi:hypothetical protein N0824_02497 [Microcystis sp. 0824]|nr:hypothetical protein N0824_02497 [Microcystis sp. 0824]
MRNVGFEIILGFMDGMVVYCLFSPPLDRLPSPNLREDF